MSPIDRLKKMMDYLGIDDIRTEYDSSFNKVIKVCREKLPPHFVKNTIQLVIHFYNNHLKMENLFLILMSGVNKTRCGFILKILK